jgi:hypothetical protein
VLNTEIPDRLNHREIREAGRYSLVNSIVNHEVDSVLRPDSTKYVPEIRSTNVQIANRV